MFMIIFLSVIALIVLSGLFFMKKNINKLESNNKAYLKPINRIKPKVKK